jgi:Tfp pilus assembly protein PilV
LILIGSDSEEGIRKECSNELFPISKGTKCGCTSRVNVSITVSTIKTQGECNTNKNRSKK